jgi:methionyl-tRNA formyltransferase
VKVWRAQVADAEGAPGTIDADANLATAAGALTLGEVQPEGKRPMTGTAWRVGLHGPARVDA